MQGHKEKVDALRRRPKTTVNFPCVVKLQFQLLADLPDFAMLQNTEADEKYCQTRRTRDRLVEERFLNYRLCASTRQNSVQDRVEPMVKRALNQPDNCHVPGPRVIVSVRRRAGSCRRLFVLRRCCDNASRKVFVRILLPICTALLDYISCCHH